MAAAGPHQLASDADREQAIDMLKAAFVQGRLTKDELDARMGRVIAARTYGDLAELTADIPARPTAPQPARGDSDQVVLGPSGHEIYSAGWYEAVSLFRRLVHGEDIASQSPSGLMLESGENALSDVVAEYWHFSGAEVTYNQHSSVALGGPVLLAATLIGTAMANAAARGAAERRAAPQWRYGGFPRAVLTDKRLLLQLPATYQWLSFWHARLFEFRPDVRTYSLYLGYTDCPLVLLRGPRIPWLSVAFAYCTYPRRQLVRLPFFSPFTDVSAGQ